MPFQWFSSKLGFANGLIKTGGGVGATFLPIAAQSLIDSVGLQWTFRIFGFLMLVTGIPAALMLKGRAPPRQSSRFHWSLLQSTPFLAVAMARAIGVFALFVSPFFLLLFASSIGLPASTSAALVAGFAESEYASDMACQRIVAAASHLRHCERLCKWWLLCRTADSGCCVGAGLCCIVDQLDGFFLDGRISAGRTDSWHVDSSHGYGGV